MSLYVKKVSHVLTGEQHAILWGLAAERLRTQPAGRYRERLENLMAQMDQAVRRAGQEVVDSTAVEVPPTPPNDEPLGFAFNRAVAALHEDIDEGDEAA